MRLHEEEDREKLKKTHTGSVRLAQFGVVKDTNNNISGASCLCIF